MRYLWCRFNFWGQYCDIKFFLLYGPWYGLGNFCSISVRKHYDHICLNLNNSKIWRRIAKIFSEIVQSCALYIWSMQTPLPKHRPFLSRVPLKMRHSTKLVIFEAPLYKLYCIRSWCPRHSAFFRGFSILQNGHSMIAILAQISPPGGPQWGHTWKFDPPWRPNLGVTPDFENFLWQPLTVPTYPVNLMSI